jgi:hypothetical protein
MKKSLVWIIDLLIQPTIKGIHLIVSRITEMANFFAVEDARELCNETIPATEQVDAAVTI